MTTVSIKETTTTTVGTDVATTTTTPPTPPTPPAGKPKSKKSPQEEIALRLVGKYHAEQDILIKEYDEENENCDGDDWEFENFMKKEGLYQYDGPMGEHPVEFETTQTSSFLYGLPKLQVPSLYGPCFCPLSQQMTAWRKEVGVSCMLKAYCGDDCDEEFGNRKSLMDHLRRRGKKDTCHRYTKEYFEEIMKSSI